MDKPLGLLKGRCWRCYPLDCKCPPEETEIAQLKSERYLIEQEMLRENRRAKEFANELQFLAQACLDAREKRLADGGEDNLPPDLHRLAQLGRQALELITEPRNEDRVTKLYKKLETEI